MGQPAVTIGLLGPLEVRVGGERVDIPRGRVRTLLAVLALSAGRSVPAETLTERVWGEDAPAKVRGSLHTSVKRLRRLLGGDRVASSAGGYLLDVPGEAVDAVRFARLLDRADGCDPSEEPDLRRQALALWRGTPFDESAPGWLTRCERPALVERRLAAVERLADLFVDAGRSDEAVSQLRDLASEHPMRESLWARLMVALGGSGRPAEALTAYQAVRTTIARELGVDPGAELQRLHSALLAGTALTGCDAPAARREVVPRQLPADVDDFSGREQALRALDEQLERKPADAATLIAVHGAGGVGKTALAVHWAWRVRDQFADGQLFVDLRGYGPGEPMAPSVALDSMLRGLGVPSERIPDAVDARGALLRTMLSDRRVLVVLDNARDADQVRPLLPGAGIVTVVTSRSQLRGLAARERAHRIGLDVLSAGEARAFLAGRLGVRPDDSVATLAELCGHLPLALTIAAERAGRRPERQLAELIAQLRDVRSRLDVLESGDELTAGLRAVISWSYRALDPAGAHLFRLLGLHPGAGIGISAAAALAGIDRSAAARLLDRLAETHLLGSPCPGRFAMHDLVRTYAAERATADEPPADRDRAVRRLFWWYAQSATSASVAIWGDTASGGSGMGETFDDDRQAMTWFGAERDTLLVVVAASAQLGLHDEIAQLVRAMAIYLDLTKAPVEIKPLLESAVSDARAARNERAEAQLLIQLGRTHEWLGELDPALRCFESARSLHRGLDDPIGECAALGNIGIIHRRLGDRDESIRQLERSIAKARHHALHDRAAAALQTLAAVYNEDGRQPEAEAAATEAVRLWRQVGPPLRVNIAVDTLGKVHLARGDLASAISCYRQAIAGFRDVDGGWWLAQTLRNLGRAQLIAGDLEAARTSWQEALRILDQVGAQDSRKLSRPELRDHLAALPE